ncbi:hypothetical protein E3N88_18749 [Mikania micrantha]|uniref:Uncharacterized protein n=1 Tax=Mikania micrantha TaxID=192012 RepID=A0A5N6NN89_9ASTR|nr:hypothetical protein E3N88_18749 [Mikania micrantha]
MLVVLFLLTVETRIRPKGQPKHGENLSNAKETMGQGYGNTRGVGGLHKGQHKQAGFDFSRALNGDKNKAMQQSKFKDNSKGKEKIPLGIDTQNFVTNQCLNKGLELEYLVVDDDIFIDENLMNVTNIQPLSDSKKQAILNALKSPARAVKAKSNVAWSDAEWVFFKDQLFSLFSVVFMLSVFCSVLLLFLVVVCGFYSFLPIEVVFVAGLLSKVLLVLGVAGCIASCSSSRCAALVVWMYLSLYRRWCFMLWGAVLLLCRCKADVVGFLSGLLQLPLASRVDVTSYEKWMEVFMAIVNRAGRWSGWGAGYWDFRFEPKTQPHHYDLVSFGWVSPFCSWAVWLFNGLFQGWVYMGCKGSNMGLLGQYRDCWLGSLLNRNYPRDLCCYWLRKDCLGSFGSFSRLLGDGVLPFFWVFTVAVDECRGCLRCAMMAGRGDRMTAVEGRAVVMRLVDGCLMKID